MKNIISILILALLIKLPGFSADCKAEDKKIGIIMGMTRGAAFHAAAVKEGLDLALEELKKEGKGYDVAWEDDQTNSAKAVTAAKLLSAKGYKLIIGPLWSFQTKALQPILAKEGLVNVIPTGASDINGGADEAIFNLCPARAKQLKVLKDWYAADKPGRALIFTPKGDWGEVHKKIVAEAMKSAGATNVWEEEYQYPLEDSLARTIVLKYKSKGIDSFFTTGGAADIAQMVKAMQTLKIAPRVMSTQDLADGIMMKLYKASDLMPTTHVVRLKVDPKFADSYRKKYQKEPQLYADRGYRAIKILSSALEATDGTREKVIDYIRTTKQFDTNGDEIDGEYEIVRAN